MTENDDERDLTCYMYMLCTFSYKLGELGNYTIPSVQKFKDEF